MEDDFFGMLGKTLTGFFAGIFRGAGKAGSRSNAKRKIRSQKRSIDVTCKKIGLCMYEKYKAGDISIIDDDISELIRDIEKRQEIIEENQKKLTK